MSGYNPRLAWLNRWDRPALLALFLAAFPGADLDRAGLLPPDRLKCALLEWAEGRHGVASLEGLEAT